MPEMKLNNEFNKEKFKQVLHYLISRCGGLDNVGKTVFYKLLYFADFNYYELYEEKLTGETYRKLPRGPAPSHFDEVASELEDEGKIRPFDDVFYGYHQHRFNSLAEPHMDLLSNEELEIIDQVINKCSLMTAREASDYSHEDLPYRATDDLEIIDYELVFYRDPKFSVRVYVDD